MKSHTYILMVFWQRGKDPLFALWLSNEIQQLNPNLGFPARGVWDLSAEMETNCG